MPSNEFAFFLQTRYLGCLQWIHTPFLYYISTRADEVDPYLQKVAPLAQTCVDVSATLIGKIACHHRHGGIWALLRRSFGCAMLLVVTAKMNRPDLVHLPEEWEELLRLSISTIQVWGRDAGAGDLEWMQNFLAQFSC